MSATLWRIAAELPAEPSADAVAGLFGEIATAVTAFETVRDGPWLVQGFTAAKPDHAALGAGLALVALVHGIDEPDLVVEKLPDIDWLKRNQESFKPFRIGRYYVHGSHIDRLPSGGMIPLRIDAATAFGTGEHATTHGCLLALDRLAKRGSMRGAPHVLDIGCGTGILAIAAAKTWKVPVLAGDIDRHSVEVARENIRVNRAQNLVRAIPSDGYRSREIRAAAPYDLVFANILARPLVALAPDLAAALAPGGIAIISGLLGYQEAFVAAAHRAVGLQFLGRIAIDGWHTLIWRRV